MAKDEIVPHLAALLGVPEDQTEEYYSNARGNGSIDIVFGGWSIEFDRTQAATVEDARKRVAHGISNVIAVWPFALGEIGESWPIPPTDRSLVEWWNADAVLPTNTNTNVGTIEQFRRNLKGLI